MGDAQFNGTPEEWDALVKKNKKKETTLEEAAENYNDDFQIKGGSKAPHIKNVHIMNHFIAGAKWQAERMLKFILDEDNHTEGELGNSCIDVQTLVHFIEQFKKK